MKILRLAAVGFFLTAAAKAQQPLLYERVLLPVVAPAPIPGAFGSSWVTGLWMRNGAAVPVRVLGYAYNCALPECTPEGTPPLNPGATIRPVTGGLQGRLFLVERQFADQIAFGLRFRDLSRQSQTWGTEIPVVREKEFRSDRVSLLDVPVTPGFRRMLRVYGLDGLNLGDARVRVRAYRLDPNITEPESAPPTLLGQAEFQLSLFANEFFPAYLAISDFSTIASLGDAQRIALIIEPVTPGLHLWAFATVVNDVTQHATVISPQ